MDYSYSRDKKQIKIPKAIGPWDFLFVDIDFIFQGNLPYVFLEKQ